LEGCVEVNDEVLEFLRESEGWEEEVFGWVDASRGSVCRVVSGVDVSGCEVAVASFQKAVNPFENSVGFCVSAPACPPALNDPNVVPEDFETWEFTMLENSSDEQFHCNCFGPADVSPVFILPW
jgi:hypothetical protein